VSFFKLITEVGPTTPFSFSFSQCEQFSVSFRMDVISASELRDRFLSIFSAAAGSTACEELYKQMAMLVPNAAKRKELLSLCPDVSVESYPSL
jgi:hypothetical protein